MELNELTAAESSSPGRSSGPVVTSPGATDTAAGGQSLAVDPLPQSSHRDIRTSQQHSEPVAGSGQRGAGDSVNEVCGRTADPSVPSDGDGKIAAHKSAPRHANARGHDTEGCDPSMLTETTSSTSRYPAPRDPQCVAVELTMKEAEAVSAFLNGLGWGDVNSVKEIVSARARLDTAIAIEKPGQRAA